MELLPERKVRAYRAMVGDMSYRDSAQMRFAEHRDMAKAFTRERANKPFNTAVRSRGDGRDWSISDTHRSEPLCDDHGIGAIPITDEYSGS